MIETFLSFACALRKHQNIFFLCLPCMRFLTMNKISNIFIKPLLGCLLLATIVLVSCGRSSVYDQSLEIGEAGWHEDSIMVFDDVVISDTVSPFNFYINLRHSEDYRYSNFYLFLNTKLPNGHTSRDTIELILADNTGKWYGKGFGHIKDNRVLVREGLVFPLKGKYKFSIEQAMREDDQVLEEVKNVGIRIESGK